MKRETERERDGEGDRHRERESDGEGDRERWGAAHLSGPYV